MAPVTATNGGYFGSDTRYRLFTALKYLVYVLLSINILLFLQEELLALEHTFAGRLSPGQIIQSFAATIDTAAWVILLLLFELETSVLDDSRIKGALKNTLHGVRGLCYLVILYAFTGYMAEWATLHEVTALVGVDACSLVGQDWSKLIEIDEYQLLGAENCAIMGSEIYRITGQTVVADSVTLRGAQYLAWTDVINSGTWILVCLVLEVEVRLQLRGKLSGGIMSATKYFKFLLYGSLFTCAAYWGYAGDFLDFWDAALWLFAFIFIELNVFEWQYETSTAEALATGS
jgi:hypothetical protein